ncbi:Fasciclin-like arabinogalactan protein [Dirofilaria immitis]
MFYWCLLSLYIICVPLAGSVNGVSGFQQLHGNLIEFPETKIATENHLSLVNKVDKCKLCMVFLEDLKAIINGTASPVASQIMMERCENEVGNKIIFEPVCELILRELKPMFKKFL